jgi:hypothetical protein
MTTPLLVLFVTVICLVTGVLAARKGYNFFLWVLAGGILGLVILAFLPFVNKGDLSEIEVREKTKTGNIIGGVFTAIALVQIVPRLLLLLAVAATPKMSGVSINGRELTQAEWDACGHSEIACLNIESSRNHR